jgi:hypothetical protein
LIVSRRRDERQSSFSASAGAARPE